AMDSDSLENVDFPNHIGQGDGDHAQLQNDAQPGGLGAHQAHGDIVGQHRPKANPGVGRHGQHGGQAEQLHQDVLVQPHPLPVGKIRVAQQIDNGEYRIGGHDDGADALHQPVGQTAAAKTSDVD